MTWSTKSVTPPIARTVTEPAATSVLPASLTCMTCLTWQSENRFLTWMQQSHSKSFSTEHMVIVGQPVQGDSRQEHCSGQAQLFEGECTIPCRLSARVWKPFQSAAPTRVLYSLPAPLSFRQHPAQNTWCISPSQQFCMLLAYLKNSQICLPLLKSQCSPRARALALQTGVH